MKFKHREHHICQRVHCRAEADIANDTIVGNIVMYDYETRAVNA